jgi:hypothetical protein
VGKKGGVLAMAVFTLLVGLLSVAAAGVGPQHHVFFIAAQNDEAERLSRTLPAEAAVRDFARSRQAEFHEINVSDLFTSVVDAASMNSAAQVQAGFFDKLRRSIFESSVGSQVDVFLSTHGEDDGTVRGVFWFSPVPLSDLIAELSQVAALRQVYFRIILDGCYGGQSLKALARSPYTCGWSASPSGSVSYHSDALVRIAQSLTSGSSYSEAFDHADPRGLNLTRTSLDEQVFPSPNRAEDAVERLKQVQPFSLNSNYTSVRDGTLVFSRYVREDIVRETTHSKCSEFLRHLNSKDSPTREDYIQEKECNDHALRFFEKSMKRSLAERHLLEVYFQPAIQNFKKCAG